jgi:hypothetical protein
MAAEKDPRCIGVLSRVSGISPECSMMTYRLAMHVTNIQTLERLSVFVCPSGAQPINETCCMRLTDS